MNWKIKFNNNTSRLPNENEIVFFDWVVTFLKDNNKLPTKKDFLNSNITSHISYEYIIFNYISIKSAVKLIDLTSNKSKWNKDNLSKILNDLHLKLQRKPTSKDLKLNGLPPMSTFINHFGSWKNALSESGL